MESTEYVFRIDAFTPSTLPMSRLAEYMTQLAELLGHQEHTHFVRLEEGSAKVVHRVDAVDAPKVEERLRSVSFGGGPKDARRAYHKLDTLLANDNAIGSLDGPVGIDFPGRLRPKALAFPSFRQDGAIEGQVVSVGGRDETAHVILQDHGVTYSNCSLNRELARKLAQLLYGPKVRLIGSGRWERQSEGVWKLLDFRVDRFEQLDESSLTDVLSDLAAIDENGLMHDAAASEILSLRGGEGRPH